MMGALWIGDAEAFVMTTGAIGDIQRVTWAAKQIRENIAQVIVGCEQVVERLLAAIFCEGHVLIEDVPGTGKTTMARALAQSLGCTFARIQFTPDLLPSDIVGVSVYNQKTQEFEFRRGPLFAQIILADEINRAGPRTQSALLEAMQERQVSVDGQTWPLERPFFVLATQNPIDLEGTFPLPEAQLDRFLMRLSIGYPSVEEERMILRRYRAFQPLHDIKPVISATELDDLAAICRGVYVHPSVESYIIRLAHATRESDDLALGVSPRGSLALYHACQALAAIRGRDYVLPDDVQELIDPLWAHRILVSTHRRLRGEVAAAILAKIRDHVPVPVEETLYWQ